MSANNISRLESPDYGKHTISSLKRIAEALDVALVVRFVPWGQYLDWLSGTPHIDEGISPKSLAVPSFEEEEKEGGFEKKAEYWKFDLTPVVPIPQTQRQNYQSMAFSVGTITQSVIVHDGERKAA